MSDISGIGLETCTGEKVVIELRNGISDCYVTGVKQTQPFVFGDRLIMGLTEEAFAHFVIRAGKDAQHCDIMRRLETNHHRMEAALTRVDALNTKLTSTVDDSIAVQLDLIDADVELVNLRAEKMRSGVRILNQMRADYAKEKVLKSTT